MIDFKKGWVNTVDLYSRASSVETGVQRSGNGSGETREESAIRRGAAKRAFGVK